MDIELLKNVLTLLLMFGALGPTLGALEKLLFSVPELAARLLDRRERARQLRAIAARFPNLSPRDRLARQRPAPRTRGRRA